MAKIILPKHKLGWSVSAGEAVKKARNSRKLKERAKVWKKIAGEEFENRWKATKEEFTSGIFNPLRVILWPAKSTFAIIGFVTVTWSRIYKARKSSKAIKEAALKNLTAVLVQEMINDPEYCKGIKKFIEQKKAVWLSVDKKGRVILSKKKSKEGINVADIVESVKPSKPGKKDWSKIEATTRAGNIFPKGRVYLSEKGSNLEVYVPARKKVELVLAKDIKRVSLIDNPATPDKKKLVLVTNSGGASIFIKNTGSKKNL